MKFTLTYDGELRPTGNSSRKPKDKWQIRQYLMPQLVDLWNVHPALIAAWQTRWIPKEKKFGWLDTHHLSSKQTREPDYERSGDHIDLCEDIRVDGYSFLPLVRDSYALICSLSILFMRKGQIGRVYQDGDLDNRIKTLLDGLKIPTEDEIEAAQPSEDPGKTIYCLLEDDRLVTGVNIETRQLLNRPDTSDFDVRLVIDVDVRVTHPRTYNHSFLGD